MSSLPTPASDASTSPAATATNLDEHAQAFSAHVVFPLVDYLQVRLDTESEVLHHLERMRRQVEWFEREKLYAAYRADPAKGEALYDARVREFLFAEGVDYPYSQPASPAGKADVVAGLDGDDPLVCEIKLYDGGSYRVWSERHGCLQRSHDPTRRAVRFGARGEEPEERDGVDAATICGEHSADQEQTRDGCMRVQVVVRRSLDLVNAPLLVQQEPVHGSQQRRLRRHHGGFPRKA